MAVKIELESSEISLINTVKMIEKLEDFFGEI